MIPGSFLLSIEVVGLDHGTGKVHYVVQGEDADDYSGNYGRDSHCLGYRRDYGSQCEIGLRNLQESLEPVLDSLSLACSEAVVHVQGHY